MRTEKRSKIHSFPARVLILLLLPGPQWSIILKKKEPWLTNLTAFVQWMLEKKNQLEILSKSPLLAQSGFPQKVIEGQLSLTTKVKGPENKWPNQYLSYFFIWVIFQESRWFQPGYNLCEVRLVKTQREYLLLKAPCEAPKSRHFFLKEVIFLEK